MTFTYISYQILLFCDLQGGVSRFYGEYISSKKKSCYSGAPKMTLNLIEVFRLTIGA